MVGLSESLIAHENIELTVVFPISSSKIIISGEIEGIKYFGFPQRKPSQSMICKQKFIYPK